MRTASVIIISAIIAFSIVVYTSHPPVRHHTYWCWPDDESVALPCGDVMEIKAI